MQETRTVEPMNLLPHFTIKLWGELEDRLKRRILEEATCWPWRTTHLVGSLRLMDSVEVKDFVTPAEAAVLARQIVRRIYRTQLREARAVISVAEAMFEYQRKISGLPHPVDAQFARISKTFRNSRHRKD